MKSALKDAPSRAGIPIYRTNEARTDLMAIYQEKLRHWPAPLEAFLVPTRYGKTHVIAMGHPAAPPVVLVHPDVCSSIVWFSLTPTLSERFRVYALDTIGDMGRSELDHFDRYPKKGPDFSAWLDDVYGELGLATADVIGGSMGGWIAMHHAIEAPDRVRRLVLLGPMELPSVNDIVLAAVTGGARRLLGGRGELKPGKVLKASVAASIRGPADEAGGNRVGIMLAPLPVGQPDPVRRLKAIARATAERKRRPPYQPSARLSQRWLVRAMFHQRLVNLLTSNLPGPPLPVYFAGAWVLEVFQVGVIQGNIMISVGALSYAGQLNLDIVGDAAVPDLPTFAEGVADALAELGIGVREPPFPTGEKVAAATKPIAGSGSTDVRLRGGRMP